MQPTLERLTEASANRSLAVLSALLPDDRKQTLPNIHPTALISPGAVLGEGTEVGPYAIVEDQVVIGRNCTIQAHAVLTNRVIMGDNNLVGHGSIIGSAPQDFAHHKEIQSEVRIGNNNALREYVTIHRGCKEQSATTLGDRNYLMGGVHLGHNCQIGNDNVMANNCLLAGYVEVTHHVVLGGGSVYHQFLRVGEMCMIRGGTAWSKDIPPYTVGEVINVVCGLNAIGMKRNGVSAKSRAEVKQAYTLLYRSGKNVSQAVKASRDFSWGPEATRFLDFAGADSKRGLCQARGRFRFS